MKTSLIDISGELLLLPWGNGVSLIRPESGSELPQKDFGLASLNEVSKTNLYLYMLDTNSTIQHLNEASITKCGYPSLKRSLGKTREMVAKQNTVERLRKEDVYIIHNNKMGIFEEEFNLLNETILNSIAFKFPWYNSNNQIIGIFGISLILDLQNLGSIINAFNLLINLRLLNTGQNGFNTFNLLPGRQIDNVYLSKRESEVVQCLVNGNTSKEAAKQLALSHRTVEHYIENIKLKLNVNTKSELIDKVLNSN